MKHSIAHNPVGWFEIYVQEMARARTFYETVFETRLTRLDNPGQPPGMEMWAFPMQQGTVGITGALVKMPGLDAGGHGVIVYFICTDCAVEAARAASSGGQLVKAKMSIGAYGYIALVVDSEGNMIGLHSMQ